MKLKFLFYRVQDVFLDFFKGKGAIKKPVLFALIFLLALASGFFFFHSGVKAPEQAQSGPMQVSSQKSAPVPSTASQINNSTAGNMTLEIIPGQAYVNTVLKLSARGFNLGDVNTQIRWTVNGMERITDPPLEFGTKDLAKGDVVQAVATIDGREIKSNSVNIGDAPLEIMKVKLMPEVFKPGDNLYVDASAADKGANIVYEWSVNGNFAGNSNRLDTPVKRGDQIVVKVTPCGTQGCGQPIVLQRRIGNMPPMLNRQINATFDGTIYTAQVSATDPDGDPVTYALESAPEGMKIDASSGLIEWKQVPPGFTGADVTVTASDGHGGVSRMIFTVKPQ